jgi:hypothetical protein
MQDIFQRAQREPIQATVRSEVARMHATHYITLGIREYSQRFPGEANVVDNSLSWNNDRTDSKLTNLFCMHCLTDFREFCHSTPAQQNHFMADCIAAQVAHETAVTGKTHKDQARAWMGWTNYCS